MQQTETSAAEAPCFSVLRRDAGRHRDALAETSNRDGPRPNADQTPSRASRTYRTHRPTENIKLETWHFLFVPDLRRPSCRLSRGERGDGGEEDGGGGGREARHLVFIYIFNVFIFISIETVPDGEGWLATSIITPNRGTNFLHHHQDHHVPGHNKIT